jgi:hypothetical protein
MAAPQHHQPAPPRRPAPGWPFWLAFGVLAPGAVIGVVLTTFIAGTGGSVVANEQRLLGNSAVVSGTFVEAEAVSALPETTSVYRATLPSSAPGSLANSEQMLAGETNFGFPPSMEFPPTRDFLVSFNNDDVVVEEVGAPGRISAVTASSITEAERTAGIQTGFVVTCWIWLGLVVTVLPTLAIRFSLRRRRAAR